LPGHHLKVPAKLFGSEHWFLLGHFSKKHLIRAITVGKPQRGKDPSDHKLWQINIEGSVKWKPQEDVKLDITDVEPHR